MDLVILAGFRVLVLNLRLWVCGFRLVGSGFEKNSCGEGSGLLSFCFFCFKTCLVFDTHFTYFHFLKLLSVSMYVSVLCLVSVYVLVLNRL